MKSFRFRHLWQYPEQNCLYVTGQRSYSISIRKKSTQALAAKVRPYRNTDSQECKQASSEHFGKNGTKWRQAVQFAHPICSYAYAPQWRHLLINSTTEVRIWLWDSSGDLCKQPQGKDGVTRRAWRVSQKPPKAMSEARGTVCLVW